MTWFLENLGTIITALILIAIIAAVLYSMLRGSSKGKSSCGCSCSSCPMGSSCHRSAGNGSQ